MPAALVYERTCKMCNEPFTANDRRMKYCSSACRILYNNIQSSERRETAKEIADKHTEMHWRNRNILASLHKKGKSEISLRELESFGFRKDFLTALQIVVVDNKSRYLFIVFDYQYMLWKQEDGSMLVRFVPRLPKMENDQK